jgi:hypothetical protein
MHYFRVPGVGRGPSSGFARPDAGDPRVRGPTPPIRHHSPPDESSNRCVIAVRDPGLGAPARYPRRRGSSSPYTPFPLTPLTAPIRYAAAPSKTLWTAAARDMSTGILTRASFRVVIALGKVAGLEIMPGRRSSRLPWSSSTGCLRSALLSRVDRRKTDAASDGGSPQTARQPQPDWPDLLGTFRPRARLTRRPESFHGSGPAFPAQRACLSPTLGLDRNPSPQRGAAHRVVPGINPPERLPAGPA